MALLMPNGGEKDTLELLLNKNSPEDLKIKLYTSNTNPAESDTAATYTEATGNGYAAVTLTPASWTITEGAPTTAEHSEVTFSFTGALGNVYGYFIVGDTSGRLKWAERFSNGPYNIQNNGDAIKITPRISLD